MSSARIADDGAGAFSAHVEHEQTQPFCFMGGPRSVALEEAVTWGRAHADEVVVRVGDVHYSAGRQPVSGLPQLRLPRAAADATAPTGLAAEWHATARTGWYRDDRAELAGRFERALRSAGGAQDAHVVADDRGFSTSFTVRSASELEAQATAFDLARAAWATLGVAAEPGEDFDVSAVEVSLSRTD